MCLSLTSLFNRNPTGTLEVVIIIIPILDMRNLTFKMMTHKFFKIVYCMLKPGIMPKSSMIFRQNVIFLLIDREYVPFQISTEIFML